MLQINTNFFLESSRDCLDDNIDFSALEEVPLFAGQGRKFTDLVIRTPKKAVTDAKGQTVFRGRQTHRMPFKMYDDEGKFYKAVEKYIQRGYKSLERLDDPMQKRAAGFLLTTFQKLNASSTAAIESALRSRLLKLKGEKLSRRFLTGTTTWNSFARAGWNLFRSTQLLVRRSPAGDLIAGKVNDFRSRHSLRLANEGWIVRQPMELEGAAGGVFEAGGE